MPKSLTFADRFGHEIHDDADDVDDDHDSGYDPGDGSDHVTCEGFGTPYPAGAEDPGEGPCGHTYLQRTPDDQPHQMTYTITYALTWSTSDGRSGSLGTFDRSVTFDYDIDEIQTVGTG